MNIPVPIPSPTNGDADQGAVRVVASDCEKFGIGNEIIMQIEPQIRFRGMEPSPSVEEVVRERIARLGGFCDRITSCVVVIEAPHRHGHQGRLYHVQVDITLPGAVVVTGKAKQSNHAHEDVYVALRDSFDAAQRQIEDIARKRSGYRVKPHPETLRGKIARLMPDEGFGFIRSQDGASFSSVARA